MSHDPTPDDTFAEWLREYQDAMASHDVDRVEATVHDIFAIAEEWCEQNPSPDLDLTTQATHCEEIADWQGAESAYRQILSLPRVEPATEWKAHADIAALCRLLGRHSHAIEEDCHSTAAARRADSEVILALSLGTQARTLVDLGRVTDALPHIEEALALTAGDEQYNQIRAGLLTSRAHCSIHDNRLPEADRDLSKAFDLLRPYTELEIAAGAHRDLARYWAAVAKLRAAREDYEGSVDAWREAVSTSRHIASLPHVDAPHARVALANALLGLSQALTRTGQSADAAFANDERIMILDSVGIPG